MESVQNNWNNLKDLINEEVKELNQKLTKIKTILINFEYEGNFKETTFKNFLKDLNSLIQTSKKNDLFFSDDDIDKQVEYLEKNLGDYLNDINSLEICIENKNNYEILTYNSFKPVGLELLFNFFINVENFVSQQESNVKGETTSFDTSDILKEIKNDLLEVIK